MKMYTQRLRSAGFTDREITTIQDYCDTAEQSGQFSRHSVWVDMEGKARLVCLTIAEILDEVRPGCWLDRAPAHATQISQPEAQAASVTEKSRAS
ncbi:MAG: hypothetical protein WAN65_05415 [Candidatus Sulfotelmatobacter sp.]